MAQPPRSGRPGPGRGAGSPSRSAGIAEERLIYGVHAVLAAWANPARRCKSLWLTATQADALSAALEAGYAALPGRPQPRLVDRLEVEALCPTGAVHQGIALEVDPLPSLVLADVLAPPRPVVVLDQVADPHNLGAVLRSAAAFGACAVVVQDRHSAPLTATVAKSASGAMELVPVIRVTNLARAMAEIKSAGYWLTGLTEHADRAFGEGALTTPCALVLGAEGEGLRRLIQEGCDHLLRLPTDPALPALNVSNAAAIALYEVRRQNLRTLA